MLAIKLNKQYSITEDERGKFLADGYDIVDECGNIVEHSPKKTVPYEEYIAVKEQLSCEKELKNIIRQLKKEKTLLEKQLRA